MSWPTTTTWDSVMVQPIKRTTDWQGLRASNPISVELFLTLLQCEEQQEKQMAERQRPLDTQDVYALLYSGTSATPSKGARK